MVDRTLAARAMRGMPWRCRRGWHDWRTTLAAKLPVGDHHEYRQSFRCNRCGTVRHEVTQT